MKLVVHEAALGPALIYPLNSAFCGSYASFAQHVGRRGHVRVKDHNGVVRATFNLESFVMVHSQKTWWRQAHRRDDGKTTALLLVHANDGRVVFKLLVNAAGG